MWPAVPGIARGYCHGKSGERNLLSAEWLSHSTDPGCRNINRYFLQIRPLCSSLCLILSSCNPQCITCANWRVQFSGKYLNLNRRHFMGWDGSVASLRGEGRAQYLFTMIRYHYRPYNGILLLMIWQLTCSDFQLMMMMLPTSVRLSTIPVMFIAALPGVQFEW